MKSLKVSPLGSHGGCSSFGINIVGLNFLGSSRPFRIAELFPHFVTSYMFPSQKVQVMYGTAPCFGPGKYFRIFYLKIPVLLG